MSSALSRIPLAFMSDSKALINEGISIPSSASTLLSSNIPSKRLSIFFIIQIISAKNRVNHLIGKVNTLQMRNFVV